MRHYAANIGDRKYFIDIMYFTTIESFLSLTKLGLETAHKGNKKYEGDIRLVIRRMQINNTANQTIITSDFVSWFHIFACSSSFWFDECFFLCTSEKVFTLATIRYIFPLQFTIINYHSESKKSLLSPQRKIKQ